MPSGPIGLTLFPQPSASVSTPVSPEERRRIVPWDPGAIKARLWRWRSPHQGPPKATRPQWRPPLPFTTAAVLLLVLAPALLLPRWSRPRAAGLEQLIGASSLLQSFPPNPERPVPALWRERLGHALAARLWRNQSSVWWQFWASHSESAPFLALSGNALGGTLPPQALKVGDLLVFAEDPIARRQLLASLRPLQPRSRGLSERCHQRLQKGQAVVWQADAIGTILGPVAPLLERYQMGCLSLEVEGKALRWQGEASPVAIPSAGLRAKGPGSTTARQLSNDDPLESTRLPLAVPPLPAQPPLPEDLLLELEGSSLDQLLQGLLSRQMIRDPLASRYGLEGASLAVVRQAPFRLRLHPLSSGPFRASLDLLIPVGATRPTWDGVLEKVRRSLSEQGFTASEGSPLDGISPTPATPSPSANQGQPGLPPAMVTPGTTPPKGSPDLGTTWKRPDGTAVGGWRWLRGGDGQPQLLFFLGPPPLAPLPISTNPRLRPSGSQLGLRVRPSALDALGLLPPDLPNLTRLGSQLWLNSEPFDLAQPQGPISRLTGRLQLGR